MLLSDLQALVIILRARSFKKPTVYEGFCDLCWVKGHSSVTLCSPWAKLAVNISWKEASSSREGRVGLSAGTPLAFGRKEKRERCGSFYHQTQEVKEVGEKMALTYRVRPKKKCTATEKPSVWKMGDVNGGWGSHDRGCCLLFKNVGWVVAPVGGIPLGD